MKGCIHYLTNWWMDPFKSKEDVMLWKTLTFGSIRRNDDFASVIRVLVMALTSRGIRVTDSGNPSRASQGFPASRLSAEPAGGRCSTFILRDVSFNDASCDVTCAAHVSASQYQRESLWRQRRKSSSPYKEGVILLFVMSFYYDDITPAKTTVIPPSVSEGGCQCQVYDVTDLDVRRWRNIRSIRFVERAAYIPLSQLERGRETK